MKHVRKKQIRRRAIEAAGSERGTMSIEVVVLVPVLLLITMVAVAGGRIVSAQGMVEAASRDAARAASMERSVGAANTAANQSLSRADTANANCSAGVDVGGFRRGGTVRVSVSCHVKLSDLGLIFLPGTTVVRAESSAPVDQWRGTR